MADPEPKVLALRDFPASEYLFPRPAEPEEPDYEDLGYPETGFGYSDPDEVAGVCATFRRWIGSLADGCTDNP